MKITILTLLALLPGLLAHADEAGFHTFEFKGYSDTPLIPGSTYLVHQDARPQPPRVIPSAPSPDPAGAPSDAIVLFDGTNLDRFQETEWQVQDGLLIAGKGGLETKEAFGDCQLHLEWRAPAPPGGKTSNMGNSGIYFMHRYELQIYDSFSSRIYADGSAGAIYGQTPPRVNACRRPGAWQCYDVLFTAPVFKDGELVEAARITVLHNGVMVHNHTRILGPTVHRGTQPYKAHAERLPFSVQGHGSPVAFRTIWVRDL